MEFINPNNLINIPLQLGDDSAQITCLNSNKQIFSTDNLIGNQLNNLGMGDTTLFTNYLSESYVNELFQSLFNEEEFTFQQWYRMPSSESDANELIPLRRVKVAMATPQEDGSIPYFRFPVNNQSRHGIISPMTPMISTICQQVSTTLHTQFNHVVVLLYRDDDDCIGYHKDKPLDLDENAPIASLSLGFPRTYSLRDRIHNPKLQQSFVIPSGSLLSLGPITNQHMYHSVLPVNSADNLSPISPADETENLNLNENENQDKKTNPNTKQQPPSSSSSSSSRARISITFRKVETFLIPSTNQIIGKGEEYQSLDWPIELKGLHRLD